MGRKIRERENFFGKAFFSKERFMLKDERGQLSIDFLVGISLFILALVFMAHFIPGMFVPFQSETIDLNSVAYRTSVILVEDPGWYNGTIQGEDWENDIANVSRIGLAIDKEHPNMLNMSKLDVFKDYAQIDDATLTDKLGLYRNIGGNPIDYGYNIRIENLSGTNIATRGEIPPEYGDVVKMKRMVWTHIGSKIFMQGIDLEGSASPTKALLYINSSDVEDFLNASITISITNFDFDLPYNPSTHTYDNIKFANDVKPSPFPNYGLNHVKTVNESGGSTSLFDETDVRYAHQEGIASPGWTINNMNDTLEIFLAKSVFENGVSLTIDGSEDVYIELNFGNGILVDPASAYPPGAPIKLNSVADYEPMELIVEVWQ